MATWLTTFSMGHPVLFAFCVCWAVLFPCLTLGTCVRVLGRCRNIRAHGWPTPPVDADGDIITRGEEP
jgi:hypothetical protein